MVALKVAGCSGRGAPSLVLLRTAICIREPATMGPAHSPALPTVWLKLPSSAKVLPSTTSESDQ